MYTSLRINAPIAVVVSIIVIIFAPVISENIFHNPQLNIPLIIAVAMLLPETISRIYASGLNGLRKIWQSNLVNETLSITMVGIGLFIMFILDIKITVIKAVILYAIGRLVVTLFVTAYWKKLFKFSSKGERITKSMLSMSLPLLFVAVVSVITSNSNLIMLGWLGNIRDVGLYSVAARLAMLMSFFLMISNTAISPKLASLFADGKIKEMNKMVKSVTGGLIIIALFSLIIFIVGGHLLLSFWGHEFKNAYLILVILSIGQFVNVSTGCAGMILIMCGFEKIHSYISFGVVVLNLILNYFLIKEFGAIGAATATAITIGSENIIKVIYAKKKVGVLTIPIFN